MVAVFEELASRCELTVLFGSVTGTRAMPWSRTELRFAHRVVGGRALRRSTPDAADIYPSPRILASLASSRPDVIISGGFSFPSLYAGAYRRLRGGRLLIHSDGTARSESRMSRAQTLTRATLTRLADGAVGNSRQAVERFDELGFRPVFLAPHSSRIEPFLEVGSRRSYRPAPSLRVLTAGRLIPRKGVDWLLRATAHARSHGTAIHLTIVGSGEEELRLRALAAELAINDVTWIGFAEHDQLPQLFAQADAFAFPTLMDPFGIVLLEAAAAGLPLIASPHGGATADLLAEQDADFIVEPQETVRFAAALARLANDHVLREQMGRRAHVLAARRTPADTAAAYLEAANAILHE